MLQKVRVIPDLKYTNRMTLNQKKCQHKKRTFLRFGLHCAEVSLFHTDELAEDELVISRNIIEFLKLPLTPTYEIKVREYEIELGPFIGILACRKKENLHEMVNVLTNYVYDYSEISGAIVAFSQDSIDIEQGCVNGYVFHPVVKEWEQTTVFYPKAIVKRAGLNKKMRNHLHSCLGNTIFNSYIFNKWEMYSWLSTNSSVNGYLPESILYEKSADVVWFLNTYSKAFIKPIHGSQGSGIIQAIKKDETFILKYEESLEQVEKVFHKEQELKTFVKDRLKRKEYIIQEALSLIKENDCVIDFRLMLIKNSEGHWEDMGLISRQGSVGNYISNISAGGSAELAENTLRRVFQFNEYEVFQFRKKITGVAIAAATALEMCGLHLGNLGVDIGIDQEKNIWIIEINNRDPNHTIAIDADERQMFYKIKRMNMLYAKYLAGFGRKE